jgi:hypothetical protein
MAQQQFNNYPLPAWQNMAHQQWTANSGTINVHNGCVYYQPVQMPAAPYPAQHNGPEGHYGAPAAFPQGGPQVPLAPGFGHQGPGFGKPRPGTNDVQTAMKHVCHCMEDLATVREKQILHVLCNDVVTRSNFERDCSTVGIEVTQKCVNLFATNEEAAKAAFWRRAGKGASQRKCRAAEKQYTSQPLGRDPNLQWPVAAPAYYQQVVGDNVGHFQADPNAALDGMLPGQNIWDPIQMQQNFPY